MDTQNQEVNVTPDAFLIEIAHALNCTVGKTLEHLKSSDILLMYDILGDPIPFPKNVFARLIRLVRLYIGLFFLGKKNRTDLIRTASIITMSKFAECSKAKNKAASFVEFLKKNAGPQIRNGVH